MKKIIVAVLVALCAFLLVGCAPKDVETAKTKMTDAGYVVVGTQLDEADENGLLGNVTATKVVIGGKSLLGDSEVLTAFYYESAKAAKKAFEEYKGEDNAQQVGKWIIYGTENAVKEFKK